MDNDIYPRDLKEDNIMINPIDFDIKLIDLDDDEVRIEEKEYIIKFPHIKKECLDKYKLMEKRLLNNSNIFIK